MLKNSDGTVQSQLPSTILFFTDGIPTRSRLDDDLGGRRGDLTSRRRRLSKRRTGRTSRRWGGTVRSDCCATVARSTSIGVYVNSDTDAESQWVTRSGYHLDYFRGDNVVFQQGANGYERANNVVFQVSTDSDLKFERWTGSSWTSDLARDVPRQQREQHGRHRQLPHPCDRIDQQQQRELDDDDRSAVLRGELVERHVRRLPYRGERRLEHARGSRSPSIGTRAATPRPTAPTGGAPRSAGGRTSTEATYHANNTVAAATPTGGAPPRRAARRTGSP
jgi:hypothetical protein